MNQYLLILRDDPAVFHQMSPQQMQQVIGKYRGWRLRMQDAGRVAGGHKLEDGTGRLLSNSGPSGELRITDGPFTESKEVVGGYFLVNAASYDDAIELCRDCPHLEFGAIEVRCIDRM
jgi:hypothetical protein